LNNVRTGLRTTILIMWGSSFSLTLNRYKSPVFVVQFSLPTPHLSHISNNMNNNAQTLQSQQPPEHQHHESSDLLPGARENQADYNSGVSNSTGTYEQGNISQDDPATMNQTGRHSPSAQGNTAFNTHRPLNVQPTSAGGVAIDGRADLPEGKADFGDKVIGKTQKVIGKYMNKPEMHERGELRESGGKAAAEGKARAPHD